MEERQSPDLLRHCPKVQDGPCLSSEDLAVFPAGVLDFAFLGLKHRSHCPCPCPSLRPASPMGHYSDSLSYLLETGMGSDLAAAVSCSLLSSQWTWGNIEHPNLQG